mgnify:CR=1 FL=1
MVGRESLFSKSLVVIPGDLREALAKARGAGNTAVLVVIAGLVKGICVVADQPKPTSAQAIVALNKLGLRSVLLTGDNSATAAAIAGCAHQGTRYHQGLFYTYKILLAQCPDML